LNGVVESKDHGKKEGCRKGKKEEMELCIGHQGEGTRSEVVLTVPEDKVEILLIKPNRGWGMEAGTIREPAGRHYRDSLNALGSHP